MKSLSACTEPTNTATCVNLHVAHSPNPQPCLTSHTCPHKTPTDAQAKKKKPKTVEAKGKVVEAG